MRVSSARFSRLSRKLAAAALAASLPLAVCTFAPVAHAQEASAQDIQQARQLGGQAQAAFDAGNFAESEKLWAAAAKLYTAAPTLTLGLARTQAKLGKFVASSESYNKIIRDAQNTPPTIPAFKDAVDAAKAEVGPVTAKIASVTLTIEGPPNPTVTIDDQPVNAAALGLKRPIDPGQHVVKASADGYTPGQTTFAVAEGGNAEAKLALVKGGGGAVVAPVPGPGTPPEGTPPGGDTGGEKKGSMNKTMAYVAFGVGGVGLVIGAVTGLIAIGKHGDLADNCAGGTCAKAKQDDVDSYHTMGTLSTVGFIIAGVGGAAGAILFFTAPKEETGSARKSNYATAPTKGVTITPYLGAGSAGVTGRF